MRKALIVILSLFVAATAFAGKPEIKRNAKKIPDQYIVVLQDGVTDVSEVADELIGRHGGFREHVFKKALKGFSVRMREEEALELASDPRVQFVEEDGIVTIDATQSSATWGLDRIDQRDLPLNSTYVYNYTGSGVKAYIIDTGILASHSQFGGRVVAGYTAINDGRGTTDCNGHGTHVAGTVGGSTYGVAKSVTLVPVRVLDCNGSGTNSGVIAGVDWVASNHAAGQPAVANMSLGGGASSALDTAVNNAIADGVTFAVAAGNDSGQNACNYSPARVANAITVGSTTSSDARSSFSNIGSCVDIFAPGSSITSAWYTSTTATNTISGTSMATPHVAGVAALYLQSNTAASPATVWTAIRDSATPNKVTNAGTGSPNRLLYSLLTSGGGTTYPPTISSFSPTSGAVGTSVTVTGTNFNGATAVRFNGTSATFTINSATQITATVPSGATTGPISVVNSAGTGTSATSFTVTSGGGTTTQLLGNAGFESGNVTWVADTGVITNSTSRTPRTGSWYAWLNGYGSSNTDYIYQTVTIPSNATAATLSFYLKIDSAETTTSTAYDKLTVTIRNTSNTVLSTLATYSNLNKSSSYVLRSFDVLSYRGQTIRVYFHGSEDSSLQTSFVIDDAALNVTQ